MAFIYGPHGMPINSHNRSSRRCAASSYFGLRPRPGPGPSFALTACESRRRAVDRPMPTATKRSSTSPLCFFDALAYSALNLFASRFLVAMSSPPSIRQASPRPAMPDGISRSPFMTNEPEFHAQTLRRTSLGCILGRKTNLQEAPLTPSYSTAQRRATTHENNTRALKKIQKELLLHGIDMSTLSYIVIGLLCPKGCACLKAVKEMIPNDSSGLC